MDSEELKLERLFCNKPSLKNNISILLKHKLFYSRLRILNQTDSYMAQKTLQDAGIVIGDAIEILDLVKGSNYHKIENKTSSKPC